jgi:hypothetical protein
MPDEINEKGERLIVTPGEYSFYFPSGPEHMRSVYDRFVAMIEIEGLGKGRSIGEWNTDNA